MRDSSRRLVGCAEAGAANVSLDFIGALQTIHDAVAAAFSSAGLPEDAISHSAAGLGLAGVSSSAVAERVRAAVPVFSTAAVGHDGLIACLGAHGGHDGGLVIAGTGSAAVLRLGGETLSIGGRGFLLGDDGSGAWIGRAIWRLAFRAWDGLEPASALLEACMAEFDRDVVRIIAWARTAPSHAFAAYAPRVFAAAEARRCGGGRRVIAGAAAAIGELIAALIARGAPRIDAGWADWRRQSRRTFQPDLTR